MARYRSGRMSSPVEVSVSLNHYSKLLGNSWQSYAKDKVKVCLDFLQALGSGSQSKVKKANSAFPGH